MNNPWEEIARPEQDLHYRLIDPDHPLRLLRARDSSDRFLFIYEFPGSDRLSETFPRLNGIDIFLNKPADPAAGNYMLILILKDKKEWQVFLSLCNDLIASTKELERGIQSTRVILRRLKKWQEFLKKTRTDILPERAIKGLLGELIFMRNHLFQAFGPAASIQFWQGPDDAPQDFNIHEAAVEIKCQSGASKPRVHISSVDQLCPSLPEMYLHVVTMGKSDQQHPDSFNLPTVIGEIRDVLTTDAPEEYENFNNLLYQTGYLDVEEYEEFNYILITEKMFKVTDGFPRICPTSIPQGVEDLSYNISLVECERFEAYPEWVNIS